MKDKWTFSVKNSEINIPETECTTTRPNLKIEEIEIKNEEGVRCFIPGKQSWEPIKLTFLAELIKKSLWKWLDNSFGLETTPKHIPTEITLNYYKLGILSESWILKDIFPTSVDFSDLDHTNNYPLQATLTVRFNNVEYQKITNELTFCHKFRFTLESKNFPKEFIYSCEFSLKEKKLKVGCYEMMYKSEKAPSVYSWISKALQSPETIIISHYDGCGNVMYSNTFSGATLENHFTKLNYKDTEASIHYLTFNFIEHNLN